MGFDLDFLRDPAHRVRIQTFDCVRVKSPPTPSITDTDQDSTSSQFVDDFAGYTKPLHHLTGG